MRKQAQPERREKCRPYRRDPAGREIFHGQGRPSIEEGPTRPEGQQKNQQDRRLLVVQPFEQRDDDSYAQENEREDVSRVAAALEPPSQNQQSCSRQTPHKVGSIAERQRQAMAAPLATITHTWRCTGKGTGRALRWERAG